MQPTISIITVVLNGKEHLKKTIESIKCQTFKDYEFIVIDGGSEDGTLEVIKENTDVISKWLSEKDKGIYDAMNKGIKLASGKYLWFLNAGDAIFSETTLTELFSVVKDFDVIYGDTELVNEEGKSFGLRQLKRPPENLTWKSMINGMVITHQSLVVKKAIAPLYNTRYKYVADIDWLIRVLQNSKVIINSHQILSKFLLGGFSRKNTLPSLIERFKILCQYFNLITVLLNHIKLFFLFIVHIIKNRKIL